jgi:hypothetical protein
MPPLPPLFGDQKIVVTIRHTPSLDGNRKGWGMCYHFGKKTIHPPLYLLSDQRILITIQYIVSNGVQIFLVTQKGMGRKGMKWQ